MVAWRRTVPHRFVVIAFGFAIAVHWTCLGVAGTAFAKTSEKPAETRAASPATDKTSSDLGGSAGKPKKSSQTNQISASEAEKGQSAELGVDANEPGTAGEGETDADSGNTAAISNVTSSEAEEKHPANESGQSNDQSQNPSRLRIVLAGVVLAIICILLFLWICGRRRPAEGRFDSHQRGSMDKNSDSSAPLPPMYARQVDEQTAAQLSQLSSQVNNLTQLVNDLRRRMEVLEAPSRKSGYSTLATSDLQHAPRKQLTATELVDRYNETMKQGDLKDLADAVSAEYFTNERSGDISTLLKSEVDRFWLVPVPGQPDTGWLIPGFVLRKSWQKFRQSVSDHPLAHHFDLLRGDKFVVNRAAVVRKDPNGEWQLVVKGEVSGIL